MCGSSTTRTRVAGEVPLVVAVGCSALRAWSWARCMAAGVTPRVAAMAGMDISATSRNRTISRSGLDSVAISADSRASTRRWRGWGNLWSWRAQAEEAGTSVVVPPMFPHGQRHRRDRPLCSSAEPPLWVPVAGRWIRSGRGPPECGQTRPRVSATLSGMLGASLVTWGTQPPGAQPQMIVMVLECAWIPRTVGARRGSPGSRRSPGRVHG